MHYQMEMTFAANPNILTRVRLGHSETIGWSFEEENRDKVKEFFIEYDNLWRNMVANDFGFNLERLKMSRR